MANDVRFWDKAAAKYALDPIQDPAAYEYTCQRTISYLTPSMSVLEVGAGTGSTALVFAPHVKRFVASDISPGMLDIARRKPGADGVDFVVATAREAVQGADAPDVIMAHSLLHLDPQVDALVQDIGKKLPSGGLFISKTTCLAAPGMGVRRWLFAALIPIMKLFGRAPSTVHAFSIDALEAKIKAAGLEIVEAGNHPVGPPPARYIVARKP